MAKTIFQSGSRVSAAWFNSLQTIEFDDLDLDGHYPRLSDDALTSASGNIKSEFYGFRDSGKVTHVSSLTVSVSALSIGLQNGTRINVPTSQIIVADNATRVIFVDANGTLQSAGSAPETGILLARVTSSGGTVSTIVDLRERSNFQVRPISVPAVAQFVMPPGSVIEFAGSVAPSGWLLCDGSEVSRVTYANLFSAIGTAFGTPSDNTVFRLPDHRNRVGRGVGTGTALGSTGGNDSVTLTTAQMPLHSHALTDNGHSHSVLDGGHTHGVADPGHIHALNLPMGGDSGAGIGTTATNTNAAADFITPSVATSNTTGVQIQGAGANIGIAASATGISIANSGGNTAVDLRNRFIAMNYLIKT